MKEVDTREYVGMLRGLVEEGREVSLLISGSSMSPFLCHHRDTVWFKAPDRKLRKGDMVFYQRSTGQFVMHRIYAIKKDGYYTVGDAQWEIEGPLDRAQIFAIITKAQRKGKMIGPGDFWWEFFARVWIRVLPLRRELRWLYGKLTFLKHRLK